MVDPSFATPGAPGEAGMADGQPSRSTTAFGSYLREARTRRGLSQSSLASRIGLSSGMVSQLEKGLSLPSVSTMLAIANELEVSLDALFGADDTASAPVAPQPAPRSPAFATAGVSAPNMPAEPYGRFAPFGISPSVGGIEAAVQRHESRSILYLEDGVTWEQLTNGPHHQVMFVIVTYPVGAATTTTRTFVRHPDVEYFLLLEGELDVSLEFERTTVRAGDSMCFDSMRPHNFENHGNVAARGVFFIVPQDHLAWHNALGETPPSHR